MAILKLNKNNLIPQKINPTENSESGEQKIDEPYYTGSQQTKEIEGSQQKVKAAQYYKKIDPDFLIMLNAQAPKRFVALFRKALTVKTK